MDHPYIGLPKSAFWKSAISNVNALEFAGIYTPKFSVFKTMEIGAAGSCFAQHIGRQFKERGYRFVDLEKPISLMGKEDLSQFGYDMYSARYGNIYSIRQLLQLFQRADGSFKPEETHWETHGRWYDPFRPSIEQNGFSSLEELQLDLAYHLGQVNLLLKSCKIFVFTFGLTEGWINKNDGSVLPTCPGTVAGDFDSSKYAFHNFTHSEILADTESFIKHAQAINPNIKFLFTVSPVPLTATASGEHVLPATVYSKSVLRGVCGELSQKYDFVDYFPSYELVTSHPMRSIFFNPNLRSVSSKGVAHVMEVFFKAIGENTSEEGLAETPEREENLAADEERIHCDELILEAFGE